MTPEESPSTHHEPIFEKISTALGPPSQRRQRKPAATEAPAQEDGPVKRHVPIMRHHKKSGQGFVVLNGKTVYLGRFDLAETQQKYHRVIAEWLSAGRQTAVHPRAITVDEVIARYIDYAEDYYSNGDGTCSTELENAKLSLRPVHCLYGDVPAVEFGPLALRTVREQMIKENKSRMDINKRINRVKAVFRWAASVQIIPGEMIHSLEALKGLRKGRCSAREGKVVKPAPMELVRAVEPYVSKQVWAIIQLQLLTGARPGELLIMQPSLIDRSTGEIWEYRPDWHKTAHLGYERHIYIGPRAQKVLSPFLLRPPESYCFSPYEAERERYRELAESRGVGQALKTKKPKKSKTRRMINGFYEVDAYRRAIERGLEWAFPLAPHLAKREDESWKEYRARLTPMEKKQIKAHRKKYHWHPHQLRHNAATELAKEFGIETARIILGHRSSLVTEVYAEQDKDKAIAAIAQVG